MPHAMRETSIPFDGFYESMHSQDLDNALEQLIADPETGNEPRAELETLWQHINWRAAYLAYAQLYADAFASWFKRETGIDLGLQWSEMVSPREYNFTTDRIFVKVRRSAVRRIYKLVDKARLDEAIREKFTSRPGFSSFYDNSLAQWLGTEPGNRYRMSGSVGRVDAWDENQVGTLLEAYIGQICDWREDVLPNLMEDTGELWDVLCEAMDAEGLAMLNEADRKEAARRYFVEHQLTLPLNP